MKNRDLFVSVLKIKSGPIFEGQCDPRGKGCGRVTTGKKD